MDFHDYMRSIAQDGLPGVYNDQEYGRFLPSCGLIELYISLDEYEKKKGYIYDLEDFLKNKSRLHSWLFSYLHEICHCYQVMGSSLGSLHVILFDLLGLYDLELKELYKANPNITYFDLYKKNIGADILERIENFKTVYDIRCLVNSGCIPYQQNKYYVPRIGDFVDTFYRGVFYTSLWRDRRNFEELVRSKETNSLIDDLMGGEDWPIDSVFSLEGYELEQKGKYLKENWGYNKPENAIIIPSHAIVEGYARHTEKIFERTYYSEKASSEDDLASLEIYMLLDHKGRGIYGAANDILRHFLGWIETERGINEYFDTVSAIYELALMTRYHPALFFLDDNPRLYEFLVPLRFQRLLNFFIEERSSISTYCDPTVNLLEGLDTICTKVGFLEYSKCLEEIYELHKIVMFEKVYPSILICEVIKRKLNGSAFYDTLKEGDHNIGVVTLLKDGACSLPTKFSEEIVSNLEDEGYDIENEIGSAQSDAFEHIIFEQSLEDLVLNADFKKTKSLYSEFYDEDFGREAIRDMIKMDGLSDFMDIDE